MDADKINTGGPGGYPGEPLEDVCEATSGQSEAPTILVVNGKALTHAGLTDFIENNRSKYRPDTNGYRHKPRKIGG